MLNLRCALTHHKGDLIPLIPRYQSEIHPKHRALTVLTLKLTRLHALPVQGQSTLQKKQTEAHQPLDHDSSGSSARLSSNKRLYLLTFNTADNNIVVALLAFDHFALHLLEFVC